MYWVLRILGEFDELLTILRSKRSTRIEKKNVRGRVSSSNSSSSSSSSTLVPYYYYHIFAVRPLRATLKKSFAHCLHLFQSPSHRAAR